MKSQRVYVSSPKSLGANVGSQDLNPGLWVLPLMKHFLVNISTYQEHTICWASDD